MANEMEQATKTAGKEMANMEVKKDEGVCVCPECGYSAPMTEFQEQESEGAEGENGEPKPGMEVQIEVGKPKLMSAREAVVSAMKGK